MSARVRLQKYLSQAGVAARRKAEVEASFRSASHLGFDDLIHPEETRDALLSALQRGIYSRQAAAEPVSRTVITP